MDILFAGTPKVAVASLKKLNTHFNIKAVITKPDLPDKRKKQFLPTPVKECAIELGIPVLHSKGDALKKEIEALKPDYVAVVAYGVLLKKDMLETAKGWVNLHFSYLPQYRGAAPVQRAIFDGHRDTGITTFLIDEGLDTGPIYLQKKVVIGNEETSGEALGRMSQIGADLLFETLVKLENKEIMPKTQSQGNYKTANKISKEEAKINWMDSNDAIVNKILSCNPQPLAWTTLLNKSENSQNKQRFIILDAQKSTNQFAKTQVGSLFIHQNACHVITKEGSIILKKVQPEGKKPMTAQAWLNGVRGISDNGATFI
jgi:methionyl-tRNA formyltransferase